MSDYSKATWGQNFIASIAGAVASITVAAPLDTVKTRIQNANFERKVHGITVIKELIKNEGPTAFFKGLTPKVRSLLPCFSRRPPNLIPSSRFSLLVPSSCSAIRWHSLSFPSLADTFRRRSHGLLPTAMTRADPHCFCNDLPLDHRHNTIIYSPPPFRLPVAVFLLVDCDCPGHSTHPSITIGSALSAVEGSKEWCDLSMWQYMGPSLRAERHKDWPRIRTSGGVLPPSNLKSL